MQLQLPQLWGDAQVIFQLQTLDGKHSGSRHEEPNAVATVMLGIVHGLIRVTD